MCLILNNPAKRTILTTDKDITCYKILSLTGSFFRTVLKKAPLAPPYFYSFRYWLGCRQHSPLLITEYIPDPAIEIGLHTFVKYDDAKKLAKKFASGYCVCECTIPAGSKFIEGVVSGSIPGIAGYASNALIVNKIKTIKTKYCTIPLLF